MFIWLEDNYLIDFEKKWYGSKAYILNLITCRFIAWKNLYSWCADGFQVFVTNGIENIKIIFLFLLLFTYTKKGDHSYHSIHTKMHNRYINHVLNSFLCTLFMNNIDLNTHSLQWLPLHSFFKLKVVPDLNMNAVQAGRN